jgi:hypothetical protein
MERRLKLKLCVLILLLMRYNAIRRSHKLTRSAIAAPSMAPWFHMLNFGDDLSFLELTGFTRDAFMRLETVVIGEGCLDQSFGRPRILDNRGRLGLLLFFVNSRMNLKQLSLLFGIVPSSTSLIIDSMLKRSVEKLKHNIHARIKFPNNAEMVDYARIIQHRERHVHNVIGFVDGLSIPVQCSDDKYEQSAAYNKYHRDTMCNNVFAFAPTGKIIFADTNYPGSWHDSTVCRALMRVVVDRIGPFAFCVDQGFRRSGEMYGKFVGPLSQTTRQQLAPVLRDLYIRKHAHYTSLRQASEWGMKGLQGTFTRLKSRLTSNHTKRGCIIKCIVLLSNFRTHFVGWNQIKTGFDPHYDAFVRIENYDRILRYFNVQE